MLQVILIYLSLTNEMNIVFGTAILTCNVVIYILFCVLVHIILYLFMHKQRLGKLFLSRYTLDSTS